MRAHDQVGAALAQRVVGEPAAGGEVRQQDAATGPGRADQRGDELAPLGRAQVDLDRALALVQPGPEQRPARRRERPAVEVDAAADLVEADDVGAELGERHAAQRRGDERRALDHPQVGERLRGHASTATKRQSSTSASSPRRGAGHARAQVQQPAAARQRLAALELDPRAQRVALEHRRGVVAGVPAEDRHERRQRARRLPGGQPDRVAAVDEPAAVGGRGRRRGGPSRR